MANQSRFFLGRRNDQLPVEFFIDRDRFAKFTEFCNKYQLDILVIDDEPVARLAPSVVTRGEVQLFNLDVPRFSLRVYLANDRGFINLRRTDEVIRRLDGEKWLKDDQGSTLAYRDTNDLVEYFAVDRPLPTLKQLFRRFHSKSMRRNLVADCLLTPPPQLRDKFKFVTADLGWVYGEGRSLDATPYVCAMPGFSGGACAQACAFMIAALLHEYPPVAKNGAGIHGLAEITAMTTPERYDLMMRGLRSRVLAEYFVLSGRAVFEYSFHQVADSLAIIAVHVRSGFAPILYVAEEDTVKFDHVVVAVGVGHRTPYELIINDPSKGPFLEWNEQKYIKSCTTRVKTPQMFCILPSVIKCPLAAATAFSSTAAPRGESPVVVGVWEMAGIVARSAQRALGPRDDVGVALASFALIQVLRFTDGEVCVPSCLDDDLAQRFWSKSHEIRSLAGRWFWLQVGRDVGGQIAKLTFWDAERPPLEGPPDRATAAECGSFVTFAAERRGNAWHVTSGVSQLTMRPLTHDELFKKPSRGIQTAGVTVNGRGRPGAGVATRYGEGNGKARRRSPDLGVSVITSFSATALGLAMTELPDDLHFVELYAFMHCDRQLFDDMTPSNEPGNPLPSIAKHLSSMYFGTRRHHGHTPHSSDLSGEQHTATAGASDATETASDRKVRRDIAKEGLAFRLRKYFDGAGLSVRAIATYMPQLYSENLRPQVEARHALCVLSELRERFDPNGETRTVVMSAGSRIKGLVPRICQEDLKTYQEDLEKYACDKAKTATAGLSKNLTKEPEPPEFCDYVTLFAVRRTEEEAIELLIARLQSLCRDMLMVLGTKQLGFSFALEIEPGPIFVLNSPKSVRTVARRIAETEELRDVVGFNVDIAHCILAGFKPTDIFDGDIVEARICHFHISDQGIGHFGDTPLGDCGFDEWRLDEAGRLALLGEWVRHASQFAAVRANAERLPKFSGVISVELEAARSPALVWRSVQNLERLLDEVLERRTFRNALVLFARRRRWPTYVDIVIAPLRRMMKWFKTVLGR